MKTSILFALITALTGTSALATGPARQLVFQCTFDSGQSQAVLKVNAVTGFGTLTTTIDSSKESANVSVSKNAATSAKFCERLKETGKSCADFQLYCISSSALFNEPDACNSNGIIIINTKELSHSYLGVGNWAGELNCH